MLSAQFVKVIYGRSYYLLLYLHCRLDEQAATIVIKAVKNINSFFMLTYFLLKRKETNILFILN
jgi:hypothetical protein